MRVLTITGLAAAVITVLIVAFIMLDKYAKHTWREDYIRDAIRNIDKEHEQLTEEDS